MDDAPIQVGDRVVEFIRFHPGFPDGEKRRGVVLDVSEIRVPNLDGGAALAGWSCLVEWDGDWDSNPEPNVNSKDLALLDVVDRLAELL